MDRENACPSGERMDDRSDSGHTDIYPSQKRSEVMRSVKGKDTEIEHLVRRSIHAMGFRFRLHAADLPGRPDVVLPRHRKVIFVNGCFWHQHPGCPRSKRPKTRADWWQSKLNRNVERDREARRELTAMGWKFLVVWECETRDRKVLIEGLRTFLTAQREG
jgi:DNA mismatch endonuclease (patch repair protein)